MESNITELINIDTMLKKSQEKLNELNTKIRILVAKILELEQKLLTLDKDNIDPNHTDYEEAIKQEIADLTKQIVILQKLKKNEFPIYPLHKVGISINDDSLLS